MNNIIGLPASKPAIGIYPTYYFADTDEVAIPRLPADPDTAAAVIGTWVRLLTIYKVLTPKQAIEAARKGAETKGVKSHEIRTNPDAGRCYRYH
jgi:hypothetical protein